MQHFNEDVFLKELHDECAADGYELLKAVPVTTNNGLSKAYVLAVKDGYGAVHGEVLIPAAMWDINGDATAWTEEYSEIDSDMLPVAAPPEILDLLTEPKSERDRRFIAKRWRKWSQLVNDGVYSEASQQE